MKRPLYQQIVTRVVAMENCRKSGNSEWQHKHGEALAELIKNRMPSGSGIDCGTKIDLEKSNADRLVFTAPYHHMNEAGFYDGWTDHTIVVTPSLLNGIDLRITGRDRNQIKDYLHEVYFNALIESVEGEIHVAA